MLETLINWDKNLFLLINGCHTPIVDNIMYFISKKTVWIPLYIFFIFLIFKYFKKQFWIILFSTIILIIISDQLSSGVMKNTFQRLRPCHDPSISGLVHLVHNDCGGRYGFVSSHAANSFALAIFLGLIFTEKLKILKSLLFIWALLISYSRIYLGVHFPMDVLTGAILGSGLAIMIFILYRWCEKRVFKF